MENFNKKSGGQAKIEEYINRIKAGESKEEIMKDLPDYFKLKIEEGLQESENKNIENKITSDEFLEKRIKNNEEDKAKIEEIRKEIGLEDESKEENLQSRIEKYNISLPNLDQIIKNGGGKLEVVANGEKIDFDLFAIEVDQQNKSAEVLFIRKKDRENNQGISLPIYIKLGKELAEKGIRLNSSFAQLGPGFSVWQKLSKLGFTEKSNGRYTFVNKTENKESIVEKGTKVSYQGKEWKIADIIPHKYETKDGEEKIVMVYNLERNDGYILENGGVTKYIYKDDFEIL